MSRNFIYDLECSLYMNDLILKIFLFIFCNFKKQEFLLNSGEKVQKI